VASLTASLYISETQLRRRCRTAVGLAPKALHRTLRFQGFLALVQQAIAQGRAPTDDGVALLALRAGYADQSHLTRECVRLTGVSPRVFPRRDATGLRVRARSFGVVRARAARRDRDAPHTGITRPSGRIALGRGTGGLDSRGARLLGPRRGPPGGRWHGGVHEPHLARQAIGSSWWRCESGGLDRGGDVVVEVAGAAQRAADALDLQLARGELPSRLTSDPGAFQRRLMTGQHPLKDRRGVIQMRRGEHSPAVMRSQHQLRAVAAPRAGRARQPLETAKDLPVGDLAGMPCACSG
jgi:AraC-like DNA-binding protein